MLRLRGYMPPAAQKKLPASPRFGGGKLTPGCLQPNGCNCLPGSLSYYQVFLSTRLEQGLYMCQ